jgi:indole-3-glycerol phosphate synthase
MRCCSSSPSSRRRSCATCSPRPRARLAALVECHTAAELDRALAVGSRIVGINNRDLATFETRLDHDTRAGAV